MSKRIIKMAVLIVLALTGARAMADVPDASSYPVLVEVEPSGTSSQTEKKEDIPWWAWAGAGVSVLAWVFMALLEFFLPVLVILALIKAAFGD